MEEILKKWANWSLHQFPKVKTPEPAIEHLKEEVDELSQSPYDLMEYADVIGLTISALYRSGHTLEDLEKAIKNKLEINRNREWIESSNLVYHHKEFV